MYRPRLYREEFNHRGFRFFQAVFRQSDLLIGVKPDDYQEEMESLALQELRRLHHLLGGVIRADPTFRTSLSPPETPGTVMESVPEKETSPELETMIRCAKETGTGPMSSVAGLVAERVGELLIQRFGLGELLVENGGDLYLRCESDLLISIHAGSAPLSDIFGMEIRPGTWGVCTSSGTLGHSFSRGSADAVTVIARSAPLADAWATALANRVHSPDDIEAVLQQAGETGEIRGCVILVGGSMGVKGEFPLKLLN